MFATPIPGADAGHVKMREAAVTAMNHVHGEGRK